MARIERVDLVRLEISSEEFKLIMYLLDGYADVYVVTAEQKTLAVNLYEELKPWLRSS